MFLYFLRVVLVSFEAIVLVCAALIWFNFKNQLDAVASILQLNDQFLTYILISPVAIGVWVVNESRLLLQEDKETTKLLINWPEYHMLKIHVWVGLLYALLFAIVSLVPWGAKSGVNNGVGLLLFLVAIVGQFIVAAGVYSARIKVKEITAHVSLS